MTQPQQPFTVLVDECAGDGRALTDELARVYGSEWRLETSREPELFLNFAVSYDGRVSFGHPSYRSAGHVTGFAFHDRWLMALLRSRADAVIVGDGTLRTEPDHLWTAEFICPEEASAFRRARDAEGRAGHPLCVLVSLSGRLPTGTAVLTEPGVRVVLATTRQGAEAARGDGSDAVAEVVALGEERVSTRALVRWLHEELGCRTLICEGGPRLYGSLLRDRVAHDLFLTLSPTIIGDGADGGWSPPTLAQGAGFLPPTAPEGRLVSVRRAGENLYLRTRFEPSPAA